MRYHLSCHLPVLTEKKGELRKWKQWIPYLKIWHLALNFLWSKHNTILLTKIYQYHSFCLYLVWHTKAKKENKIETLHLILPEFFSLPYVCIFFFPLTKTIGYFRIQTTFTFETRLSANPLLWKGVWFAWE